MSARRALFAASLLALVSACASSQAGARRLWVPAYLFGSIGGGDVDVRDLCVSGRAESLAVSSSLGTIGVSVATLGVYTPRLVKVRCAP